MTRISSITTNNYVLALSDTPAKAETPALPANQQAAGSAASSFKKTTSPTEPTTPAKAPEDPQAPSRREMGAVVTLIGVGALAMCRFIIQAAQETSATATVAETAEAVVVAEGAATVATEAGAGAEAATAAGVAVTVVSKGNPISLLLSIFDFRIFDDQNRRLSGELSGI